MRIAILTGAILAVSLAASAQPRRGPGSPLYNTATEATITGVVVDVQSHQGRVGGTGTHLAVKTDQGTVDVHVGPTNWLSKQNYTFAKGDAIQVLGSKVTVNGADAFIAREITRGEAKMVLRNDSGIPEWSGGRRRAR